METHCGVIDKNNDTLMGQLQVLQNKAAMVLLNWFTTKKFINWGTKIVWT